MGKIITANESREVKHTATPWRLHDMEQSTIVGHDHLAIADCNANRRTAKECLANTDFVLEAVNNYESLKEQLERQRELLKRYGHHEIMCPMHTMPIHGCNCGFAEALKELKMPSVPVFSCEIKRLESLLKQRESEIEELRKVGEQYQVSIDELKNLHGKELTEKLKLKSRVAEFQDGIKHLISLFDPISENVLLKYAKELLARSGG